MGNDISVLVQRMINIIDYKAKINGAESYDKADALRDLKRGRIDVLGGVYFNKMNFFLI